MVQLSFNRGSPAVFQGFSKMLLVSGSIVGFCMVRVWFSFGSIVVPSRLFRAFLRRYCFLRGSILALLWFSVGSVVIRTNIHNV